jgi:hypothetical protein
MYLVLHQLKKTFAQFFWLVSTDMSKNWTLMYGNFYMYYIFFMMKKVQHKLVQRQLVQWQLVQRQLVQFYKCGNLYNGSLSHEPVVEK